MILVSLGILILVVGVTDGRINKKERKKGRKEKGLHEYMKLVVFVIASKEQNNGFITVNLWEGSEKRVQQACWSGGRYGCYLVSLEVLILFCWPCWDTEGGAGEWEDQSSSSNSQERKANYQVDYNGEGNMFETARDFCLQAWKEKASACLNSNESKGLARELKNKTLRVSSPSHTTYLMPFLSSTSHIPWVMNTQCNVY